MKFRDHRTGFDTVMFAGDNADGNLSLSLNYRVPRLEAVIPRPMMASGYAKCVYCLHGVSEHGDEGCESECWCRYSRSQLLELGDQPSLLLLSVSPLTCTA